MKKGRLTFRQPAGTQAVRAQPVPAPPVQMQPPAGDVFPAG
jgi:hypothetical protein